LEASTGGFGRTFLTERLMDRRCIQTVDYIQSPAHGSGQKAAPPNSQHQYCADES
jgi:hypothetical protein